MKVDTFRLVDEQPGFVVISKHAGVDFHSSAGLPGVMAAVRQALGLAELFPVHRLDKMTSGLLLFAKHVDVARQLNDAFAARKVRKYYLALSDRKPKKKQGLIKGDMVKTRNGSWKLTSGNTRPAITQFFSYGLAEPGSPRIFMLRPHTGKTHQLRVALKSLGSPIIGDSRYYGAEAHRCDRGYLHAYCLGFELDGRQYDYCDVPREGVWFNSSAFQAWLQATGDPQRLPWPALR